MLKTAQIIAIVTSILIFAPTLASAQMESGGGSMGSDSSMGMSKNKSSMMMKKKKAMMMRKKSHMMKNGSMGTGGGM